MSPSDEPPSPNESMAPFDLSEEERRRIRESVAYEKRVRELLKEEGKEKKTSVWEALNSGFVLLVLTTALSSILVPIYQRRNERAEWVRKTQAENGAFKLARMRECYKEFQLMASALPQADDFYQRVRSSSSRTAAELEGFDQKISGLEPDRIKHFANIRALLAYARDDKALGTLLASYNDASRTTLEDMHSFIGLRKLLLAPPKGVQPDLVESRLDQLDQMIGEVSPTDKARDALQKALMDSIRREENRYENFDVSAAADR